MTRRYRKSDKRSRPAVQYPDWSGCPELVRHAGTEEKMMQRENNLLRQVNQTRHQLERTQRTVDSLGSEVKRTTVMAKRLEQYVAQLRERLKSRG